MAAAASMWNALLLTLFLLLSGCWDAMTEGSSAQFVGFLAQTWLFRVGGFCQERFQSWWNISCWLVIRIVGFPKAAVLLSDNQTHLVKPPGLRACQQPQWRCDSNRCVCLSQLPYVGKVQACLSRSQHVFIYPVWDEMTLKPCDSARNTARSFVLLCLKTWVLN